LLLLLPVLAAPAQDRAAVREINGILDRFETCFLDEDIAGIETMLADHYILAIDDRDAPNGARILPRDQYVAAQEYKFSVVDYLEHAHVERTIEVHGPMAISRSTIVDRQANGQSGRSRVFHAYARIDGRWQIVFSSSRLAE
jgi:hypothetical protein